LTDSKTFLPKIEPRSLFEEGRTHNTWREQPVDDSTLRRIYELAKLGPTSMNCSPLRVKFIRSPELKMQVIEALAEGNRNKAAAAPVTAVLGMDVEFYSQLATLFPHAPGASIRFEANKDLARETAFRNSSLQGGYFILAARACGIDCGPMSGFDKAKIDRIVWRGTPVETNFVCNLGFGRREDLFPRSPRLNFDKACEII